MKIHFSDMEASRIPQFKGGKGDFIAKMQTDELNKILLGRLEAGATIGCHRHDTGSEIIYILEGNGKCLYDGTEEKLTAGDCHYCPKGHEHGLINDSESDLVFFAVVSEQ